MWLVTRWLYRMSLVVEMKPQLWQTPAGRLCSQDPGVGCPPPPAPSQPPPTAQRVCVHLEVPLTVGLGGKGRQADQTYKGAFSWNTGLSEGWAPGAQLAKDL